MAPTRPLRPGINGLERVRAQLLTSLHLGKLRPGERAPSVRRLAEQTGLNRKTVHRAYQALAEEGLLELRPGSGSFVSDDGAGSPGRPSSAELLRAANRCRAEAASLGLPIESFAGFLSNLLGESLKRMSVAVVECNREQIGLIADDLQRQLGVKARPVALDELTADPRLALSGVSGVVTTDCHRAEVTALASGVGVPIHSVALDRTFPQRILDAARDRAVVLVVRDRAFAPAFLRLLGQITDRRDVLDRVLIVEPADARRVILEAGPDVSVYVSPMVERSTAWKVPDGVHRISLRWHLSAVSVERLRVQLALERTMSTNDAMPPRAVSQ